jgi:hypothetical protein
MRGFSAQIKLHQTGPFVSQRDSTLQSTEEGGYKQVDIVDVESCGMVTKNMAGFKKDISIGGSNIKNSIFSLKGVLFCSSCPIAILRSTKVD